MAHAVGVRTNRRCLKIELTTRFFAPILNKVLSGRSLLEGSDPVTAQKKSLQDYALQRLAVACRPSFASSFPFVAL